MSDDVGQPKEPSSRVWDTEKERERKAAYRERQRVERELAATHAKLRDALERARLAYIEREVRITQDQIDRGLLRTTDAKGNDLNLIERSRAYAAWRWQEVGAGTVATL